MSKNKKKVEIEIYEDMDKLLDKIVEDYNLPDKSKAVRVLLDYVDEKEMEWLKRQGFKTFPIIYDSKDNHIGGYLEFMEYLHEKNS